MSDLNETPPEFPDNKPRTSKPRSLKIMTVVVASILAGVGLGVLTDSCGTSTSEVPKESKPRAKSQNERTDDKSLPQETKAREFVVETFQGHKMSFGGRVERDAFKTGQGACGSSPASEVARDLGMNPNSDLSAIAEEFGSVYSTLSIRGAAELGCYDGLVYWSNEH